MAKFDDETPNFDNLDDLMSTGDELEPLEPEMLDMPGDLGLEEATGLEAVPIESEESTLAESIGEGPVESPQEEPQEVAEAAADEQKPAKKAVKLPTSMDWVAVIAVAVVVFALAVINMVTFATAVYVTSVALVVCGIWKGRDTNSAYTVLLGLSLIAVLTAVYCLWIELSRYNYNVSAKTQASVSAPASVDRLG